MTEISTPSAISGIKDPEKIRVVLYVNNQFVHAPLNALLEKLFKRIAILEDKMESK